MSSVSVSVSSVSVTSPKTIFLSGLLFALGYLWLWGNKRSIANISNSKIDVSYQVGGMV